MNRGGICVYWDLEIQCVTVDRSVHPRYITQRYGNLWYCSDQQCRSWLRRGKALDGGWASSSTHAHSPRLLTYFSNLLNLNSLHASVICSPQPKERNTPTESRINKPLPDPQCLVVPTLPCLPSSLVAVRLPRPGRSQARIP